MLRVLLLLLIAAPAVAAERELTLLFSANVRGRSGLAVGEDGGWVRLAGALQACRREAGDARTLWLDGGNTLAGTFGASLHRGAAGSLALGSLGCDAWIPGPDDLAFGLPILIQRAAAAGVPVFNANLRLGDEAPLPAWGIVARGGCRIGVLGLNAAGLDWRYRGAPWGGLDTGDLRAAVEAHIAELTRRQPEVLVAVLHEPCLPGARRTVRDLAWSLAQFDLLLGGYGERPEPGRRLGRCWYVNPGTAGRYLARIDLRVDVDKRCVNAVESQLLPVADYDAAEALVDLFEPLVDTAAEVAASEILPHGGVSPGGKPGIDHRFAAILGRALARNGGGDVVLTPGRRVYWPYSRPVTEGDLFGAVPGEHRVLVGQLAGADLHAVFEEQLRHRDEAVFRAPWGMVVQVSDDARRVVVIRRADGTRVAPTERVTVVVDSHAAAGADGAFPELRRLLARPDSALGDTGSTVRDALRAYLRNDPDWRRDPIPWLQFAR